MNLPAVHALLTELAETPQPPSAIDVGRARAAGRRRLRLRRGATAAIAVVVGLAMIATGLLLPRERPPIVPVAPTSFDPLVQYADFGWLPDGFTDLRVTSERDYQTLVAMPPGGDRPGVVRNAMLTVVSAGHWTRTNNRGRFVGDGDPSYVEAAPVNGRPARSRFGDGGFSLQWEFAPDAWAEVHVGDGQLAGVDELMATARRIAESARFGGDGPLAMPVRLREALPGGLRPVEANRSTGASGWDANVSVARLGDHESATGEWPVWVSVQPDGEPISAPTTTVDGHPARVWNEVGGDNVLEVDMDGAKVLVVYKDAVADLFPDGLEGLFRRLEIHPDPADWR